ncbi:MAG: DUF3592 domain-containing protein [Parvularculaceae bacterium]
MDKSERKDWRLFWAACLFLAIAGGSSYAAFSAVKDFSQARASGGWERIEGVVLSAAPGAPPLRYVYHVRGRTYEGHRLAFRTRGYIGDPPVTRPGARVGVYVSPDDPRVATLVSGGSGRKFAVWFVAAGLGVFVGVAGLIRTGMAADFDEFDAEPAFSRPTGSLEPQSGRVLR